MERSVNYLKSGRGACFGIPLMMMETTQIASVRWPGYGGPIHHAPSVAQDAEARSEAPLLAGLLFWKQSQPSAFAPKCEARPAVFPGLRNNGLRATLLGPFLCAPKRRCESAKRFCGSGLEPLHNADPGLGSFISAPAASAGASSP